MSRLITGLSVGFWGAFVPLFAETGVVDAESILKNGGIVFLCMVLCYATTFLAKITIEYIDRWGKVKDERIEDKDKALEACHKAIQEMVADLRKERERMDAFEKLILK